MQLPVGRPEIDVIAALGAEGLERTFIDPVALEVEEADEGLEVLE